MFAGCRDFCFMYRGFNGIGRMQAHYSNDATSTTSATNTVTTTSTATQTTTPLTAIESTKNSIVQVWIPSSNGGADDFEALGVPVGDGTTMLTIINYEDYSPGEVKVISPENGTFTATIQAIDARTGATILKLDAGKLPPVTTRDPTTLLANEKLIVWGLDNSDTVPQATDIIGPAIAPGLSALDFGISLSPLVDKNGDYYGHWAQGAVVIDQSGKVLGLESIYTFGLVIRLGPANFIPPIISVDSAAELLSPTANEQPWANGPFLLSVNTGGYFGYNRDYLPIANAVTRVLNELGAQLPISDLPQDFLSYAYGNIATGSPDGFLLTMVFPRPVNLCNSAGTVLAQVKWVGIQWDRNEGGPNRVVYGSVTYNVEGSFEITGEISSLESAVQAMLSDPLPYGQ